MLLGNLGYDPTYGARPLKRAIQKHLVDPLALAILEGEFGEGDTVRVDAADGELVLVKAGAPAAAAVSAASAGRHRLARCADDPIVSRDMTGQRAARTPALPARARSPRRGRRRARGARAGTRSGSENTATAAELMPTAPRWTWPHTTRRIRGDVSSSAAERATVRPTGRPIASSAAIPISIGGWCIARIVGVSGVVVEAS